MAAWVRESLDGPGTDEEKSERFAEWLRQELRRQMTEAQVDSYVVAAPFRVAVARAGALLEKASGN